MSLVHLANACSHLQNASLARLGLTSLPRTNQLHTLLLQMQKFGYVNNVTIGGPAPPPPSGIAPVLSTNPAARGDVSSHVAPRAINTSQPPAPGEAESRDGDGVTQANISSRRLWIGLKYRNQTPVLEKMQLVSKPTRRVWMGVPQLEGLVRGEQQGYVRGLRAVGGGDVC
ncbi:MAG: hypothetical protein OHK93_002281 [Ramalina farinacea]|uniref:Uncharacterized protein n=1 Tax=Ramalina farinacea TaxID=258253 RepID=A0AA43QVH8_9LECA|nr:hypothetical protein [Ramalina farinacea]